MRLGYQIPKKSLGASWQRELSSFLSSVPGHSRQQSHSIAKLEPSMIIGTVKCWECAEMAAEGQWEARTLNSIQSSAQNPLGHLNLRMWFSAWDAEARNEI